MRYRNTRLSFVFICLFTVLALITAGCASEGNNGGGHSPSMAVEKEFTPG